VSTAEHVADRLAAFADGEMPGEEAARVSTHLRECAACRETWERYRFAAGILQQLTPVEAPPSIRAALDAALDARATAAMHAPHTQWWRRPAFVSLAAAALLVTAVTAAGLWWRNTTRQAPWDVVRLDVPGRAALLAAGEWVETDARSTARIGIGRIGTVEMAPNTRMQLLVARPDEHRLHLAEGLISAEILAPPRIFFVETPASTVVDLGCAYTMQVDQDGAGVLRVTGGWASLEWGGRESLVPAGASCHTRPSVGPGTPAFDDASARMRAALFDFDFGPEPDSALDVILSEARVRDTLTLWHLLARVNPGDRTRVFDRIVSLAPLPGGVDRERALTLDPDTMRIWREELAWTW
jgi:anti-sigma factor RsiW